jgi:glycosyltransferase involved in cell wall biosynthesis
MRICFIADSSSIHVQRIVSHCLHKKDDILVLSSASYISNIPGTRTVHLLSGNMPIDIASSGEEKNYRSFSRFLKSFISPSLKFFLKFTMISLNLQRKSMLCMKEIHRFNPEVIYCFRSFPEGMLASQCHIRPLLMRTAGADISRFPRYPVYRQTIRKALQTADMLVTESNWEGKLIQDLCGPSVAPKVIIIGVNTTLFHPPLSRDDLRDKYGLPRNAFVVVTNRYLDQPYNGWFIVKSVQSILHECRDLILLYASPSKMSLRTKIQAGSITEDLPRIKFLDGPLPHSEVPDILGCGDAYVSFSSCDGIPNSLLEAMACGLVPIVAELPQLHEWIDHGVTGYFVPQYDKKHLACVINYLYNHRNELSEMAARCVSKIREQGSYDVCMERTRDLLKRLTHAGSTISSRS